MAQLVRSEIYPLVASIGGLNAKDPIVNMGEQYALSLINLIPTTQSLIRRKGYELVNTVSADNSIEGLFSYNKIDGSSVLIATANKDFFNVATNTSILGSPAPTITSNKWRAVNFSNRMYFVNGVDDVVYYDGTSVKSAGYTISGVAPTIKFSNVSHYRQRIYFVQSDSLSLWYGGLGYIQGDLSEYDMSTIFTKGGRIVYAGASTNEIGGNDANIFCVVTSVGEVVFFEGYSPDSETWQIRGHFYISDILPTSRGDPCFNYGSDLQLITSEGIVSISSILNGSKSEFDEQKYKSLTDNIVLKFSKAVQTSGSYFGWQGCYSSDNNIIVVNVPTSSNTSEQYVMHTTSRAWCQFSGINALRWCSSGGKLYFGDSSGNVWLYTGDKDGVTSLYNGDSVYIKIETAYSSLGVPTLNKKLGLVRPIFKHSTDISLSGVVTSDYIMKVPLSFPTIRNDNAGGAWNNGDWDISTWGGSAVDWFTASINGIGRVFSIALEGNSEESSFELFEFDLTFERGGYL